MTYIRNIKLNKADINSFIELLRKENDVYFTLSQPNVSPFVINGLNSAGYLLLHFDYPVKIIGYSKECDDTAIKIKHKQLDTLFDKYTI